MKIIYAELTPLVVVDPGWAGGPIGTQMTTIIQLAVMPSSVAEAEAVARARSLPDGLAEALEGILTTGLLSGDPRAE